MQGTEEGGELGKKTRTEHPRFEFRTTELVGDAGLMAQLFNLRLINTDDEFVLLQRTEPNLELPGAVKKAWKRLQDIQTRFEKTRVEMLLLPPTSESAAEKEARRIAVSQTTFLTVLRGRLLSFSLCLMQLAATRAALAGRCCRSLLRRLRLRRRA